MPGLEGDCKSPDEKIATMVQLQQKEGGEVPDKQSVDAEFRRGLEELVRDHFDSCMALASSSNSNANREDLDFQIQCDGCGSFDDEEGGRNNDSNGEEGRVEDDFTGRPSQILRRWYDRQAQNVITTMERQARQAELLALAGLHAVSMLDSSFLRDPVPPPSSGERLDHQRRPSPLLEMWRGLEEERRAGRGISRRVASSEAEREDATATVTTTNPTDGAEEQTPASRDDELPGNSSSGSFDASRHDETRQVADDGDGTSRQSVRQIMNRWLNERVGADNQINESRREQNELLDLSERERVRQLAREWLRPTTRREGSDSDDATTNESWESQRRRDRQLILDLLIRTERERQQELEGLSENRVVSRFPHRGRLQSLLRGRFLGNGIRHEEERHVSSAARELGQLRQRRAVSGLREGFRSRLESVVRVQATNFEDGPGTSGENVRTWTTARRMNDLEEATAYNVELRELLGRRSVTNVLASEFRERLDQLIRSFIHRQVPWPLENNNAAAQAQNDVAPVVQTERAEQRPAIPPPPPPPPPIQRFWQQEFVHGQWPRPSSSYMVWDNASQLRADISHLQQGLGDLQRMVETIVDMQMELQRSIRQEVAGALQRMYSAGRGLPERSGDGSQWIPVKKGTCCICCDKSIDSLLYRCGHMCTCLRCANQLMNGGSKCPMCRAPIVEVVRAFTIA